MVLSLLPLYLHLIQPTWIYSSLQTHYSICIILYYILPGYCNIDHSCASVHVTFAMDAFLWVFLWLTSSSKLTSNLVYSGKPFLISLPPYDLNLFSPGLWDIHRVPLSTYHDVVQLLPFLAHCLEYTRCSFNIMSTFSLFLSRTRFQSLSFFFVLRFFQPSQLGYRVEVHFLYSFFFVGSVKSPQALFVLCIDRFMEIEDKSTKLILETHSGFLLLSSSFLSVMKTGISARLLPSDLCSALEFPKPFHAFDLAFRCLMNPSLCDWCLLGWGYG